MKQVMWDEPEPELSHGTVIRYNIGYKQVCTKPNQTKQSRPTSEKERLKALLMPTYSLEQRAHTSSMTSTDTSGIRRGKRSIRQGKKNIRQGKKMHKTR